MEWNCQVIEPTDRLFIAPLMTNAEYLPSVKVVKYTKPEVSCMWVVYTRKKYLIYYAAVMAMVETNLFQVFPLPYQCSQV